MTREEQKAKDRWEYVSDRLCNSDYPIYNEENELECAFDAGVKWADAHPQDRWISVEDELPAYDREVVVLIQDYPNDDEHLRVAFGHRPNPNGWVTKDGGRLYAMTYDKGGWNGKNIRYWLDVKLPNEE